MRPWDELARRYDVVESDVSVGAVTFRLARVRDVNALVDAMTPEDFGPDERLPYWSALWPAATDLARHVLARPPSSGRTIELGAGLGLVSLAAARRGDHVLATDYEADALGFLAHNAALNRLSLDVAEIDYRRWPDGHRGAYTCVLGSDVLYEARAVEPVADSVQWLLAPGGEAWIADPGRPHLPGFLAALTARGLVAERIPSGQTTLVRVGAVPAASRVD